MHVEPAAEAKETAAEPKVQVTVTAAEPAAKFTETEAEPEVAAEVTTTEAAAPAPASAAVEDQKEAVEQVPGEKAKEELPEEKSSPEEEQSKEEEKPKTAEVESEKKVEDEVAVEEKGCIRHLYRSYLNVHEVLNRHNLTQSQVFDQLD